MLGVLLKPGGHISVSKVDKIHLLGSSHFGEKGRHQINRHLNIEYPV